MTFGQIAILAVIVGVFFTLGVVLAWASWYPQSRTYRRVRHHHGATQRATA
jgi:hypothetical protein